MPRHEAPHLQPGFVLQKTSTADCNTRPCALTLPSATAPPSHLATKQKFSTFMCKALILYPEQHIHPCLRLCTPHDSFQILLSSGIDRLSVGWLTRGRDTRQEDVEGSPTQSRISPSILVYEDKNRSTGTVTCRAQATLAASSSLRSLNPKPHTLNMKPETLNLNPGTWTPKP